MATKGGRKNLKRAVNDETLILQPGQSIMQVVSLRGNNQIEVYRCLFATYPTFLIGYTDAYYARF